MQLLISKMPSIICLLSIIRFFLPSRKEILQFLDPKSQHWAKDEATTLLAQADKNKDMMVSMEEMFARADIFLMSKLVSADLSFHGEF